MGCVLPCNDDYQEHSEKEEFEVEVVSEVAAPAIEAVAAVPPVPSVTKAEEMQEQSDVTPQAKTDEKAKSKNGKKDLAIVTSPLKPEQVMVDVPTPMNGGATNHVKVTNTTPVRNLIAKLDFGDVNSVVFKGTSASQKFSNKTSYDLRFLWVNLYNSTLNLSEYTSKEKRHKEVSIKDIVSVVQALPVKADKRKDADKLNIDLCLTISFTKGGGIDVSFQSKDDRDLWYSTLNKLMLATA